MRFKLPVGIEVETCIPENNKPDLKSWNHGRDSSIDSPDYYEDAEFKSKKLRGKKQINIALKELQKTSIKYRYRSNETCGTHIHIGYFSDKKITTKTNNHLKKMVLLFLKLEPLFFATTTRDRLFNEFCPPLGTYLNFDDIYKRPSAFTAICLCNTIAMQNSKRFFMLRNSHHLIYDRTALNLKTPHNTVEFRLFHGTLNIKYIYAWIEMCSQLIQRSSELTLQQIADIDPTNYNHCFKSILNLEPRTISILKRLLRQRLKNEKCSNIEQIIISNISLIKDDRYNCFKNLKLSKKEQLLKQHKDLRLANKTLYSLVLKDILMIDDIVTIPLIHNIVEKHAKTIFKTNNNQPKMVSKNRS